MALQKDQIRLTIFTPTYNRAYILPNLYESLKKQTSKNFEWLIVDDGSEDETILLLKKWKEENFLDIKYLKKENGGKHRAINYAVSHTNSELFFIVDSDDYLTFDAVENIYNEWNNIGNKEKFAGLCFRRMNYRTGIIIGDKFPDSPIDASSLTISYKWKIYGDKAEIFRTDLLHKFPFPEIEGEKFITEAIVWNKIAVCDSPLLRCINKGIYMCEYLEDGLTFNFMKLLKKNPKGYTLYYRNLLSLSCVWKSPKDLLKVIVRTVQSYYYLFNMG